MTTYDPAGYPRPTRTTTMAVADGIDLTLEDRDLTRPFLLLHGGGGPATMRGFADLLAERTHSRVLIPIHPGFEATIRLAGLASVRDLAAAYIALLDELDLADVTVIGNSFGGWVAAEMALLNSPRLSSAVIVDGVGIEVDAHPMTNVSGLAPGDLAKLSFHDPAKAPRPPTPSTGPGPSPNIAALIAYTGLTMSDPTLAERLAGVDLPVHVIWGESDGIVDPDYGRAYAEAIQGSVFTLLPRTGHLPQVETPEQVLDAIIGTR
jgi:pimeloyl-ACP methyl ester carboxylesterase